MPPKVAIAEAIRLSRKFATPESATFVNAILDALYKSPVLRKKNMSVFPHPCERDKPLSAYSTFGIGGPARFFSEVTAASRCRRSSVIVCLLNCAIS